MSSRVDPCRTAGPQALACVSVDKKDVLKPTADLSMFRTKADKTYSITGREREFWAFFMKQECYNPNLITDEMLDHWTDGARQPGGLTGIFETYRSVFKNAEINIESAKKKLTCPVMTIGAPEFFGPLVEENMRLVAENVEQAEIFEECGHSLALEKPERLAASLKRFMLGK